MVPGSPPQLRMRTMKRFDPESKCKKCGSGNSYYRYFAAWGRTGECIRHLCRDCGFAWSEAPLDSGPVVEGVHALADRIVGDESIKCYVKGTPTGIECQILSSPSPGGQKVSVGWGNTWQEAVVDAKRNLDANYD